MAGRGRFKIPSANEINDKCTEVPTVSLFANYKNKKSNETDKPGTGTSTHQVSSLKGSLTTTKIDANKVVSSTANSTSGASSSSSASASKSTVTSSTTNTASTGPSTGPSAETQHKSAGSASSTVPAPAVKAASSNSIIVNYRQRGNPILKHIRNIPWEYGSIVPDYVMGKANCALFLSLRYHQLNATYLHNRLKELGKGYDLRVLLVNVDVKDPHHLLKDLAKICILADLTLMLAFSTEEAGRYLEAYKVYENKPAEALMEKIDSDYISKLTDCVTTVKSVNKTDSMTLLSAFKSMAGIVDASKEDLSLCAGFGPQKAKRLHDVFHEPFLRVRKRISNNSPGASPTKKGR